MLDYEIALSYSRARIEETERRAALYSRLGERPGVSRFRLFRREASPLSSDVVVSHAAPASQNSSARAA